MERKKDDKEIGYGYHSYAAEEDNEKKAADTSCQSTDPPVREEGTQTVYKERELG